jgi:hypothetical protein
MDTSPRGCARAAGDKGWIRQLVGSCASIKSQQAMPRSKLFNPLTPDLRVVKLAGLSASPKPAGGKLQASAYCLPA